VVSPRRTEILPENSIMRARSDILPHIIARRMTYWLQIAVCPIMNRRVPTWKARRNYRALVRKYPEIAARLGYSEALSYPSPLHGLQQQEPPLIDPSAPAREQPPVAAPTPAYVSPAMTRRVPHPVLLDGEVV
jgi:hypothetical protein